MPTGRIQIWGWGAWHEGWILLRQEKGLWKGRMDGACGNDLVGDGGRGHLTAPRWVKLEGRASAKVGRRQTLLLQAAQGAHDRNVGRTGPKSLLLEAGSQCKGQTDRRTFAQEEEATVYFGFPFLCAWRLERGQQREQWWLEFLVLGLGV